MGIPKKETKTIRAVVFRRICSRNFSAQSCVCSQIKHGQRIPPQIRTHDCLVKRAPHASGKLKSSATHTQCGYHHACTISSRSDIIAAGDIIKKSMRRQAHFTKQVIARNCGLSSRPSYFDSEDDLCGEIARTSKALSNKRTLVAFAYATLEQ